MKTSIQKTGLVIFICAAIIFPVFSQADVYMKQKQHSDGFSIMGQNQPASDLITEVWISKDKVSSRNENQSYIIRLDKGMTYVLDHKKKTYIEIPMDVGKMASSVLPDADKEEMKKRVIDSFLAGP